MRSSFAKYLLSFLEHSPTPDQDRAIALLTRFVFSDNPKVGCILKGYAGTGKTTLIGALVKALQQVNQSCVLLAPTGRAAKVLRNYAGKEAMTIHRKIYYQQQDETMFFFSRGKNLHKNTLFIVDEASMIAAQTGFQTGAYEAVDLLDDLLQYVYLAKGCKVLFVGDTAQLPPVGSIESPALDQAFLSQSYGIPFGSIVLQQVVRQEQESGILYNATRLRELITDSATDQPTIQLTTSFPDVIAITGNELQDELETAIGQYGIEQVIMICRSNKRANLFNQQIRHRILYHDSELNTGDLLMVVKNNYHWLKSSSPMGFIANGDIIEVLRIVRYEDVYGVRFADITARFVDFPQHPEFECKIILESIMTPHASLPYDFTQGLFHRIEEDFGEVRSKRKRESLVRKTAHYNALQVKFSYSVTCHKAQGGQWPVVFIDQGFLTEDMIDTAYVRWLYTALTRATEKVFLVNFHTSFLAS